MKQIFFQMAFVDLTFLTVSALTDPVSLNSLLKFRVFLISFTQFLVDYFGKWKRVYVTKWIFSTPFVSNEWIHAGFVGFRALPFNDFNLCSIYFSILTFVQVRFLFC